MVLLGFDRLDTNKTGKIEKQVILQMLFKSAGVLDNMNNINQEDKHQIEVMV